MKNTLKNIFCFILITCLSISTSNICHAGGTFTPTNTNSPIKAGRSYAKCDHVSDCEVHHLISNSFCEKHSIATTSAPSVTIPKYIHKKTGSYGSSHSADTYRELENTLYKKYGLNSVILLGIFDLSRTVNDEGKTLGTTSKNHILRSISTFTRDRCKLFYVSAPMRRVSFTPKKCTSKTGRIPCVMSPTSDEEMWEYLFQNVFKIYDKFKPTPKGYITEKIIADAIEYAKLQTSVTPPPAKKPRL